MKVLITGGLGSIGSPLVDAVILRELNVCALDNLSRETLKEEGMA